jgi:signal transduction histidine kinase
VPQQLWFWGDATKLQQVVLNLLNNAIQAFATKDVLQPSIVLNCQLVEGWVELQVQDNGCGIDVAAQDDVFALFKSPRSHGMGVGLWLSQSVVQDHGGTIEFTSTPGQGTVFVLRLPVRDSGAQIS